MKLERHILLMSLAVNLAACCLAGAFIHKRGGIAWVTRKAAGASSASPADIRASVYAELPTRPTDTVFLGDSLVNFGEWSELMEDPNCRNRGVSGNTTANVLDRLPAIVAGHPRRIVLLVGINDLQRGRSVDEAARGIESIVRNIRENSPATAVYVLPVLPINESLYSTFILPQHPGVHKPRSVDVQRLNDTVAGALAGQSSVSVVDTSSLLERAQIAPQYTFDGLHLNGKGLAAMAKLVKAAL